MPLIKTELLIPRVLCIGTKEGEPNDTSRDYISGNIITVGDYLSNSDFLSMKATAEYLGGLVEKFPHLFKPLPWWYGRTVEEMPQYVKDENGEVWKVTKYFIDSSVACFYTGELEKEGWLKGTETPFNLLAVEPADLTDYMEYQKQNDA